MVMEQSPLLNRVMCQIPVVLGICSGDIAPFLQHGLITLYILRKEPRMFQPHRWQQQRRVWPAAVSRRTGMLQAARLIISLTCPPAARSALMFSTTTTLATTLASQSLL